MRNQLILSLLTALALTSCGQDHKKVEAPAAEKAPEVTTANDQAPATLIARVPLSEVESTESSSNVSYAFSQGDQTDLTAETTAGAFTQGTQLEVRDELDQTSSTEQWHRYRPYSLVNRIGRALFGPSARFFYATGHRYYSYRGYYSYGGYGYYNYGCNY